VLVVDSSSASVAMLWKQGKPRGVVELSYKVFNFTEDQDLKLKLGYNVVKQVST
jgi:hypothetical protein